MTAENNTIAATTGAVIVASYASRTTQRFRPILSVGGQSMIRQIVNTFHAAGIETIYVVTGMQSDEVRAELKGTDIQLIHNPDYAASDMLGSAKLGLAQCSKSCTRIFVSPVCIPSFSVSTVRQLLNCQQEVCIPICGGIGGHPVLLGKKAVDHLLAYQGPDGMRGGLRQMEDCVCRLPIQEPGISHNMHTPSEYTNALAQQQNRRFHQQIQVRLTGKEAFFGPGPQQLLLAIKSRGSVAGACQAVGLSYSKGRGIIRQMEQELGFCLVDRIQGGANGGSAHLTAKGETFLEIYARYEQAVADYAAEIFEDYFGELEEMKKCD